MERLRSVRTWTASSKIPCLLALSTLTTVAVGQTALSMTTLGLDILITSFSYSSKQALLSIALTLFFFLISFTFLFVPTAFSVLQQQRKSNKTWQR
uniref:Uncharacterized protein n=1 Tax=Rhizophora mucronata TaxID=61149 RepID=A0A2P2NJN6_RHIMU